MPAEKDPATGRFVSADATATPAVEVKPAKTAEATAEKPKEQEKEKPASQDGDDGGPIGRYFTDFVSARKKPGDEKPKEDKPPEKAKTDTAPTPKKEVKPATPAKPALATAPIAKKVSEPLVDVKAVAREVAREILTEQEKPKAAEPAADPDEGLSASEKRKVSVLRHMETMQPEKYKGTAEKYKANLKKLADYAANWKRKNPRHDFDSDSPEHTEFFESNQLYQPWEDDDYDDARVDMVASKRVAEATKEANQRLSVFEKKQKIEDERPVISAHQTNSAIKFWEQAGDEFKGLVLPNGTPDYKRMAELREKNPHTFNEVLRFAEKLDVMVEQTYLLKTGLSHYNKDNATHRELSEFAMGKERELSSKPLEQRLNEKGQSFLPMAEYNATPEAKRGAYWTFNESDLAHLLAYDYGKQMRSFVAAEEEKFSKYAAARGLIAKPVGADPVKEEATSSDNPPATDDSKPESPSSTATPKLAASAETAKPTQEKGVNAWGKKFLS